MPHGDRNAEVGRVAATRALRLLHTHQGVGSTGSPGGPSTCVPIAQVALVDADRRRARSSAGTAPQDVPRATSSCSFTIDSGQ